MNTLLYTDNEGKHWSSNSFFSVYHPILIALLKTSYRNARNIESDIIDGGLKRKLKSAIDKYKVIFLNPHSNFAILVQ